MNETTKAVVEAVEVIVNCVVYRFATIEEAKEFKKEMMNQ